jgi:hypothetical protein
LGDDGQDRARPRGSSVGTGATRRAVTGVASPSDLGADKARGDPAVATTPALDALDRTATPVAVSERERGPSGREWRCARRWLHPG